MDRRALGTVAVTGASGFLGSALCRALLGGGARVIGLVRSAGGVPEDIVSHDCFEAREIDMASYENLGSVLSQREAGTLFHLAWTAPWGERFSDAAVQFDNARASAALASAAVGLGVGRFVFAGTYNQYEAVDLELEGAARPRSTTVYSAAKLSADLVCKTLAVQGGMEYCSGLVSMVYGPGDRSTKLTNVIIHQLLAGETPRLIPENIPYDCVFVEDVASAFIAIGVSGVPGTSYYIGHSQIATVGDWMRAFRDEVSPGAAIDFGAYPYGGGVDFSRVDTGRLERDTGFSCRDDFGYGVDETARWVRENNPLGYGLSN